MGSEGTIPRGEPRPTAGRRAAARASSCRDPWQLLEHALENTPAFAWRDAGGRSFVTWGAREAFTSPADVAFERALAWCSSLHEHATVEHAAIPRVVGGFPFAAGAAGGGEAPWSQAHLWCPREWAYQAAGGEILLSRGAAAAHATPALPSLALAPTFAEHPAREGYEAGVEAALAAFEHGTLNKVVLARSAVAAVAGVDIAATARALAAAFPRATIYLCALDRDQVLVGASPETLAEVTGGVLRTQALAGTSLLGEDLLARDKDRREHQLVVDDILASLGPLCPRVEHAATPELAASGALQHLCTPIRARLPEGSGVLDVVARLHPTAALAGAPRAAARDWLARHEGIDRGWYGAPIGWLGAGGDGAFAVAIRCALLSGGALRCYAGAGLVPGSRPAAEWHETTLKLEAATRCLRGVP
jgi:salicylate biosynthesis isochorismate synthase